ncbi:SYF2 splicing factor-domain-containing protein [Ochromonadaceae sp. CCMP2298]|nr:SYF2 splicing factor-domain-containing protein [Ochromonadaceae sp. CCMP2298]
MNNPKHEGKQRYLQKVAEAAEGDNAEGAPGAEKKKWSKDGDIMNQTAEQAEFAAEKAQKKKDNMSTFGWQAFTAEATHRAYEKRIKKLPTNLGGGRRGDGEEGSSHLEENPLDYGKQGAQVTRAGLDRLTKDMEEREEAREKFSRRRTHLEGADVDYINDRNAAFNKKLKKSYDKYTVEIRQSLERGTAL